MQHTGGLIKGRGDCGYTIWGECSTTRSTLNLIILLVYFIVFPKSALVIKTIDQNEIHGTGYRGNNIGSYIHCDNGVMIGTTYTNRIIIAVITSRLLAKQIHIDT